MAYSLNKEEFLQEQKRKMSGRKSQTKNSTFADLSSWYLNQLEEQEFSCHYCGISIFEIRQLLNAGIISGRKVKGEGLRGPNFEIDRKDPFGVYREDNCVLSCYYCNNDKSNTFSYNIYKELIGPAKQVAMRAILNSLTT